MGKEISIRDYQKAYRTIELKDAKNSFITHVIIYVLVNAGLISINLFADQGSVLWFYWPLAGWGFGLVMHYIFGVVFADREFANKEALAEKMAREAVEEQFIQ